jgi:NAD(P)H-dependent FMN reductase
MKILAINGSHRGEKGFTHRLVQRLLAGAAEAGATTEEVVLARLKIQRCVSCGKCNSQDHYLRCVYHDRDDVQQVFGKMAAADVVVFATPIYVFNLTGLFKTFLDRLYSTSDVFDMKLTASGLLFHHVDRAICSKPLCVLVCCDSLEPAVWQSAVTYFHTYARFMDAPVVGTLVRTGGRLVGHGADPDAESKFPRLREVYAAFAAAGGELARDGRVRRATERRAGQSLIAVPRLVQALAGLRPVKQKMLERARAMTERRDGDV